MLYNFAYTHYSLILKVNDKNILWNSSIHIGLLLVDSLNSVFLYNFLYKWDYLSSNFCL